MNLDFIGGELIRNPLRGLDSKRYRLLKILSNGFTCNRPRCIREGFTIEQVIAMEKELEEEAETVDEDYEEVLNGKEEVEYDAD